MALYACHPLSICADLPFLSALWHTSSQGSGSLVGISIFVRKLRVSLLIVALLGLVGAMGILIAGVGLPSVSVVLFAEVRLVIYSIVGWLASLGISIVFVPFCL